MSAFKVGDVVKCIDAQHYNGGPLTEGLTYEVVEVNPASLRDGVVMQLRETGTFWWDGSRFELVEDPWAGVPAPDPEHMEWAKGDTPLTPESANLLAALKNPGGDPVNHPSHYRWLPNGVEVIDITETLNFNMGNVIKYTLRADHKGNPIEDLSKARWFLDREIARRQSIG